MRLKSVFNSIFVLVFRELMENQKWKLGDINKIKYFRLRKNIYYFYIQEVELGKLYVYDEVILCESFKLFGVM